MATFRIWHFMVVVAGLAILFTVNRFESRCTPLSPLVAELYVCGYLGIRGARLRGRRWHTGLLFGLLLGPIGVILAYSNPIPEGLSASSRKSHLAGNSDIRSGQRFDPVRKLQNMNEI
jgi:hypothetical protein